ncbi:MAG: CPBP family intramembrane metalloprotease [Lachnospiraceae bacterium]|nr:CPBP family intramembrane metalloprotease [Lachnospiraceae bacterium]
MNNQVNEEIKKPGKVSTVLFCIWVAIAVFLILNGVSVIGMIPVAMKAVMSAGGDPIAAQSAIAELATDGALLTYLQLAGEIVGIIVVSIWYYNGYVKKDKNAGKYEPFTKRFNKAYDALFVVFGVVAIWGLANLISQLATILFPGQAELLSQALGQIVGGNEFIGAITVVILAPVCEELAMRGIILQRSNKVFAVVGCMIISAVCFGLFHMNMIQGLYVLPMGLFWGFVGYKYNSVVPCIICHIINNALGLFMPAAVHPAILFGVCGAIAVFIGIKFKLFSVDKKEEAYVEES